MQALKSNSEISLSKIENKAYMFIDFFDQKQDANLPRQIRDKYIITKTLGVWVLTSVYYWLSSFCARKMSTVDFKTRGAYGEVKMAFVKETCEKRAVKIIQKKKFSVHGRSQIVRVFHGYHIN